MERLLYTSESGRAGMPIDSEQTFTMSRSVADVRKAFVSKWHLRGIVVLVFDVYMGSWYWYLLMCHSSSCFLKRYGHYASSGSARAAGNHDLEHPFFIQQPSLGKRREGGGDNKIKKN